MPDGDTYRTIVDLAPDDWFLDKDRSSILVRVYRSFMANKDDFAQLTGFNLLNVRVFPVLGSLTYNKTDDPVINNSDDGNITVNMGRVRRENTPEGTYLVFITPLDIDGVKGNEEVARERIKSAVGFLLASLGRNIAPIFIYESIDAMAGNSTSITSKVINNFAYYGAPDLSPASRTRIYQFNDTLNNLDARIRDRVRLASRWFEDATNSMGLDRFLKCWFAIEILGMPDDTNIRPINEALARSYNLSLAEAAERFKIGRIFGLRSRVVHNGQVFVPSDLLLLYLEGLFWDISADLLGLQCEQRANEAMQKPDFDLVSFLPNQ